MPVGSWRGQAADLAVAAVATAIMIMASLQSADLPSRPVDARAIAGIAGIGGWTAVARRAPRVAVVGSCVTFFAVLALGVPAFSPALAVGVPVFVAAWSGHLWWAAAVLGVIGVVGAPYRLTGPGAEPAGQVAVDSLFDLALVGVVLLLGDTLRSRRALREEAAFRLKLAEEESRRRLTEGRLRAARDLHDVLAHTVAVVGIQASVAAETIDTRPAEARRALDRVRSATREATADLRSTIAILREEMSEDNREPAPGIRQLPELIASVRDAGLEASMSLRGDPARLRPTVDLAVYRIVQEALTNVLRHAGARSAWVTVESRPGAVEVTIRDDGAGTPPGTGQDVGGSGLRGMAERAEAIGGQLWHGRPPDGAPGFFVHARLPTGEA